MVKDSDKNPRNIDIWLVLVIVLMVLAIGGGLWVTGQSLLARMDVLSTQTLSHLERVELEVFELRKQLQTVDFKLRAMSKSGTAEPKAAAPKAAAPKAAAPKAAAPKAPAPPK